MLTSRTGALRWRGHRRSVVDADRGFLLSGAAYVVSIAVVWGRLTGKVNGLGGRVKKTEESCATLGGVVAHVESRVAEIAADGRSVYERLGRVEKAIDGTNEHMTEMKLELAGHLSEIKMLISEKDGSTRERMARLEEQIKSS